MFQLGQPNVILSVMPTQTQPQREPLVDFLNVLFAAVVLYLHHVSYTHYYLPYVKAWHVFLVFFSVGGFIFFSAYKLTQSKRADSFSAFWKNRFIRIIPLYWLAVFAFQFIIYNNQPSLPTVIKHLLGLQMVFPKMFDGLFQTLYFVGLLFLFYIFFSLTKRLLHRPRRFLLVAAGVYLTIFGLKMLIPERNIFFDDAVLNYFPIFVAGMMAAARPKRGSFRGLTVVTLGVMWFIFMPFFLYTISDPLSLSPQRLLLYNGLIGATLIPLYYALVECSRYVRRVPRVFMWLAPITYPIYLFHQPIWTLLSSLYPDRTFSQWISISFFGTALIVAISYLLQTGNTKLARWVWSDTPSTTIVKRKSGAGQIKKPPERFS